MTLLDHILRLLAAIPAGIIAGFLLIFLGACALDVIEFLVRVPFRFYVRRRYGNAVAALKPPLGPTRYASHPRIVVIGYCARLQLFKIENWLFQRYCADFRARWFGSFRHDEQRRFSEAMGPGGVKPSSSVPTSESDPQRPETSPLVGEQTDRPAHIRGLSAQQPQTTFLLINL